MRGNFSTANQTDVWQHRNFHHEPEYQTGSLITRAENTRRYVNKEGMTKDVVVEGLAVFRLFQFESKGQFIKGKLSPVSLKSIQILLPSPKQPADAVFPL